MNRRQDPPCADDEQLRQAAGWRVRLAELDRPSTPEFEAWLSTPGNAAAWRVVVGAWDLAGEAAVSTPLARRLQDARNLSWHARAPGQSRRLLPRIAAAGVAGFLLAVAGWSVAHWLDRPESYAAGIGERRVVTLADGSLLSLDSRSEVTVRYTRSARELRLKSGQARFDVAHDVQRPFSVVAGNHKVIATGTAFNVDLSGPKVLVTLIEGRVVVVEDRPRAVPDRSHPLPSRRDEVELTEGQQLSISADEPATIVTANLQGVTAWMKGQLFFDDEPLSSVIERFNHYTVTPIAIDDPRIADMRISGLFRAGDVGGFLETVTQYLPLRAVAGARAIELKVIEKDLATDSAG